MGKRKPDPETGRMVFKNVPSDILYLVKHSVAISYMYNLEAEGGNEECYDSDTLFRKLPKQKQEQLLTDYFAEMVMEVENRRPLDFAEETMTRYHHEQRLLKEEQSEKETETKTPPSYGNDL